MQDLEHRLHVIAGKRWRIAIILSILMLVIYYGFILLVAFNREFLGRIVVTVDRAGAALPGLSWGILLGALVIVFAWVLTLVYTNWANNKYDAEVSALRR